MLLTICVIGIVGYINIDTDITKNTASTDLALQVGTISHGVRGENDTSTNNTDISMNNSDVSTNYVQEKNDTSTKNTDISTNNSDTSTNYSNNTDIHMGDSIEQLFDSKRMELQSEPEEDCFCPNGRKNWIHYTDCPGQVGHNHGAGIKDRQNILRNVMWYADELCAKIALKCTPEVWLSEAHGCFAPPKARWDVYFTPIRKTSNGTVLTAKDILHWDVNETMFEGLEEIKGEAANIAGYEIGRKLYSEGTSFVWRFDVSYWKTDLYTPKNLWPHQILNHRKYSADTCGVVDFDTSEELLNVAQLVLQELNIQHSNNFVTLHLRRGDYKKCDTLVETVIEYLKCSIDGDNIQKVLVLTNGQKWYVRNLQEAFSKAFPQWSMISVDHFIESESFIETLNKRNLVSAHVGDKFLNDNCFRFGAERVLASMSRYHLDRGHTHCQSCDRGGSVNANGTPIIRI